MTDAELGQSLNLLGACICWSIFVAVVLVVFGVLIGAGLKWLDEEFA